MGTGLYLVFNSVFTYLVVAYRPIAASAMAANSAVRSFFAAGFPLFAGAMYAKLGTVGATALLAGLMTVMAPLP
jgi:predicted phage tail protein